MAYDKQLVAGKLRRWEKYLNRFRLPQWEDIPDFGLYMEQVIVLLKKYLDYLPPELKEEQIITAAAINNYVRTKVMPGPNKKKYYRIHIAYLIIICSLKQNLSLAMLQKIIPMGINEDEVKEIYESFAKRHNLAAQYFVEQVRLAAASILDHDEKSFQGLETLACRLESHRTVTATTTPILIRNTHVVDMQKTVTVALRSKRRHLHLLHHHH